MLRVNTWAGIELPDPEATSSSMFAVALVIQENVVPGSVLSNTISSTCVPEQIVCIRSILVISGTGNNKKLWLLDALPHSLVSSTVIVYVLGVIKFIVGLDELALLPSINSQSVGEVPPVIIQLNSWVFASHKSKSYVGVISAGAQTSSIESRVIVGGAFTFIFCGGLTIVPQVLVALNVNEYVPGPVKSRSGFTEVSSVPFIKL